MPLEDSTSPLETRLQEDLDILWALVGAYLVFFMQAGFAMLEAGTVRKQNTVNILIKNLLDTCAAALIWWGVGYPLAFGQGSDSNRFVGGSNFFMADLAVSENPKFYSHWVFQWAFAATSATIVSGAAAERCRYQAYVIYTLVITGFVYPVAVHWAWSEWGWLSPSREEGTFDGSLGLIDYAGSSVVHVTGGGAAFFAALWLGPRVGRFDSNGKVLELRSSSQSLIMLGTFVLWFGWYAFNTVSGLCVEGCMITASLAAVNTTLAAASGSVFVLVIHVARGNPIQIAPGLNGLLAGLVGITAGCAVVEPYAAVIIGICSGSAYYYCALLLLQLKIDDPLEASCVHMSPGIVGTVAVGFFATETNLQRAYSSYFEPGDTDYGVFYGGNGRQLSIQILGTVVIALWTSVINCALFAMLHYTGKLRVPPSYELERLNASFHGTQDLQAAMQEFNQQDQENGATPDPSVHPTASSPHTPSE